MSKTIDNRVVEMQFDNQKFERNVQTSMNTIDKLKKALNFDSVSNGFNKINESSEKVNFGQLSDSVEAVRIKFSALQAIALGALFNIGNAAVNTGKKVVSALAIDPIKMGFKEYETQINAVQTILANTSSKGTTLTQVNRALDELNEYADKTIYNFTEMTKNIGTFTAAGIDLDTSVSAIKGIANLAAVSGSTSQQASTAMYQLSQALSSGTIKLQDWNSVVNAGMGGQVFQDALKETARIHGIAVDDIIKKEGSFRESLKEGWITSEILTETLSKFTGDLNEKQLKSMGYTEDQIASIIKMGQTANDAATKVKTFTQLFDTLQEAAQSGWTQSWEIIVGDFEEAKELLTEISDIFGGIIGKSAEARNDVLLKGLGSGWKQMLQQGIADEEGFKESIKNVAKERGIEIDKLIEQSGSFEKALKKGWITTDIVSESIAKLTDKTRGLSNEEIEKLGYTRKQIDALEELDEAVKKGSISLDDLVKRIGRPSGRENMIDAFRNSLNELLRIGGAVKEAFREIVPAITGEKLYDLTVKIKEFTANFKMSDKSLQNVKSTFRGLFAVVNIFGQALSALGGGIVRVVKAFFPASEGLLSFTGTFGEYLVKLNEAIEKSGIFGKVVSTLVGFIEKTVKIGGDLIGFLKKAAEYLKENFAIPGYQAFIDIIDRINARFGGVGNKALTAKEKVISFFGGIGEKIKDSKIAEVLESLLKTLGKLAGIAIGGIGKGIEKAIDGLANVNFNTFVDATNGILAGGLTVGLIKFIKDLNSPLKGLGDIMKGFASMFDSVGGVLGQVKSSLEAYQTSLKAETLMKIAKAIALLAAAILVISLIDSNKLTASLGAITVLFADLMASMALINKVGVSGVKSTATLISTMMSMSMAILILSGALKIVAGLDAEQTARGVLAIGSLTAMMVAAAKALSSSGGKMMKGAANMFIFSFAIKSLAKTCSELAKLSWDELSRGLAGVGALLAEVAVFLNIAKFGKISMTTAIGMVALAGSLRILSGVVSIFGEMDKNQLIQGVATMGAVLLEIGGFIKLTGGSGNLIGVSIAVITIAGAMKILSRVLSELGSLSIEDLIKGLAAMGVALAEIAVATRLMPKNLIFIGAGLVVVGASLNIISSALKNMARLSWDEVAKGLVSLGGSLLILAGGLHLMNGTLAGSAALTVAAIAISILTPSLISLGKMKLSQIAKGLGVMAAALAILGAAGVLLSPALPGILGIAAAFALFGAGVLGIGVGLTAAATGLTALSVAITVFVSSVAGLIPALISRLGQAIVLLCNVVRDSAPALGEAFKALLLTLIDTAVTVVPELVDGILYVISEVLKSLSENAKSIIGLIMKFVIGLIEGIAENTPELIKTVFKLVESVLKGVADSLKDFDKDILLNGLLGIGAMTALMYALSAVAPLIPGAMVGIVGLGLAVTELSLVLAAIGKLSQIPGILDFVNGGGELLKGVGSAIGKFVGGIVGGFGSGMSSNFPRIGSDLSAFMMNVKPFIDGASSINSSVLAGATTLASTILILTATDILNGLSSWLTGGSSLSSFAEQLVPFGTAMKDFSLVISGMDGESVSNAAIAGKTIAEMAATLPNSGGVLGFFAGENDFDTFGEKLVLFGKAMKEFSKEVSGTDGEAVKNAAIAGKAIAEMAATLPNSGGVVGFFTGENDVDTFGEKIVPFGKAMKDFSDAIKGVDPEVIINSATAGKSIVELARTIPNSGGAVEFFTGNNDIDKFGEKLVPFGKAMREYSEVITGINAEAINNSATVGKSLVELANTLPNTGGVVSWFTGDNDISAFGESLVSFGEDFRKYSDYMAGVDTGIVTATSNAAKSIVELQNSLPKTGGWFSDNTTLESFGRDMNSFGSYFEDFYGYVRDINPETLNKVIKELSYFIAVSKGMKDLDTSKMNGFSSALKKIGEAGIQNFIDSFRESNERISQTAKEFIDKFKSSIEEHSKKVVDACLSMVGKVITELDLKKDKFYSVGETYSVKLIAGIKSKESDAKIAFLNLVLACKTELEGLYDAFYAVGQYLVGGFAAGITANTWLAEARARAMAKAAAKAAEQELDINSPSKVGYRIGDFFGMGFVNAISDYEEAAFTSSSNMAERAKGGLAKVIANIQNFMDSEVNTQPTIRPVLDLSDIERNSRQLDILLTRDRAYSVDSFNRESSGGIDANYQKGNINYNFTQNNYSPKALSRVDIYRQTKNQFSALERMVEA